MSEDPTDADLSCAALSALLDVSLLLSESLDQEVVRKTAVDVAVHVVGADAGAMYLHDGSDLVMRASTREEHREFASEPPRVEVVRFPSVARALRGREPFATDEIDDTDMLLLSRIVAEPNDVRWIIYLPLVARGTVEGVIVACTTGHDSWHTELDLAVARMLAGQIALAVQNSRLIDEAHQNAAELRNAYDATLESWSAALDIRDDGVPGHTQRAAELACELAHELGIPDREIQHVRRGALLHDIGKMAVPESILKKPGPLTDEEWDLVRTHPVIGGEFLARVGYLGPALDIPYYHHERWDGTGYPNGLKGTRIPLAARIYAVIDVYDALISDRPYRKAWTRAEAMSYVLSEAGAHFDPVVVAAFAECIDDLVPPGN